MADPWNLAPRAAAEAVIQAQRAAGGGGVYLGTVADGWVWGGVEHAALVLGPPRSGKTSAVVVPSVAAAPGAVVCTSTKPDIATVTAPLRRRVGPCFVFDPSGTVPPIAGVEPLRWSPVPSCRRWDDALVMAGSMVDTARRVAGAGLADGGHWSERAGALLAPLLHAAALDGADMATVVRWVDCHQAGPALTVLDRSGAEAAGNLLAGIAATDAREQSGIWSSASGTLRAYRSDAALQSTTACRFDAGALIDAGATIYVCAAARQQVAMAPLVVGLLTEVRAAVYARAAAWEAAGRAAGAGGPLPPHPPHPPGRPGPPVPVLFALDEVANIAPIPDLPGMVSEAGGQGLTVLACLQDLSQARRRWGADADGFLSLFGATVVLPGIGDVHTLSALSALAGDEDVVQRSVTTPVAPARRPLAALAERLLLGPAAGATTRTPNATFATVRRRRLPVETIAQGPADAGGPLGTAFLLDRRNRPHWLTLTPWFATEPWHLALGPEPSVPVPGRPTGPTRRAGPPGVAATPAERSRSRPTPPELGLGR